MTALSTTHRYVNLNFEKFFGLVSDFGLDIDFGFVQLQCDAVGFGKEHLGILNKVEGEHDVGASATRVAILTRNAIAHAFCLSGGKSKPKKSQLCRNPLLVDS